MTRAEKAEPIAQVALAMIAIGRVQGRNCAAGHQPQPISTGGIQKLGSQRGYLVCLDQKIGQKHECDKSKYTPFEVEIKSRACGVSTESAGVQRLL